MIVIIYAFFINIVVAHEYDSSIIVQPFAFTDKKILYLFVDKMSSSRIPIRIPIPFIKFCCHRGGPQQFEKKLTRFLS